MVKRLDWHLGHLDALRGLAVLGVILVHSTFFPRRLENLGHTFQNIASSGQRGVQLFFVVSAFTLFLSWSNRREEKSPTRNFFLRRFFRLAPMFYLCIPLTSLLFPVFRGSPAQTAIAMSFLNGFSPGTIHAGTAGGWSIADEAIFYFTLPFLFRYIASLRTSVLWLAIGAPLCLVTSMVLSHYDTVHEEFYMFFLMTSEFAVFLIGIVAYFLWRDYIVRMPADAGVRRTLSACVMVAILILYWCDLPFSNANLYGTSLLCGMLLLALSLHPWPLLVNRTTILLGKISYSMYLLHFFIVGRIQRWLMQLATTHPLLQQHPRLQVAIAFFATVAIAAGLSCLTWRYIEQPGILLGRRLITLLEGRSHRGGLTIPKHALSDPANSTDAQF